MYVNNDVNMATEFWHPFFQYLHFTFLKNRFISIFTNWVIVLHFIRHYFIKVIMTVKEASSYTHIKSFKNTSTYTNFTWNGIHLNNSKYWTQDAASSFSFSDKWRHRDINTITVDSFCVSQLLDFVRTHCYLRIYMPYDYFNGIWSVPINSTICRCNKIILRQSVNQVMLRSWKWWVHYSL